MTDFPEHKNIQFENLNLLGQDFCKGGKREQNVKG